MAILSGNGGKMQIGVADFHIGKWTLSKNPRLAECTNSGNTSGTRYKKVVLDPSWSCELPFDAAATIEAAGLDAGTEVSSLKFKLGSGTTYYTLATTTVETVEAICDNNGDVVRYRITGKGGDLTGPA